MGEMLSIVELEAQSVHTFVREVEDLAILAEQQIVTWLESDWIVDHRTRMSDLTKLRGFDPTSVSCTKNPGGAVCQEFNQSFFQDTTEGRTVEVWVPGWADSHFYDHERAAASVIANGTSESNFVNAMGNGWCTRRDSSLTAYCAANFPACPSDTLANPLTPNEWRSRNGTLGGSGSSVCPKFCLQPAKFENSVLDAEIAFTQPVWTFLRQMYDKFANVGAYWYWYGADSGMVVYAPSLEAWGGFGAFVPWDFM